MLIIVIQAFSGIGQIIGSYIFIKSFQFFSLIKKSLYVPPTNFPHTIRSRTAGLKLCSFHLYFIGKIVQTYNTLHVPCMDLTFINFFILY